MKILATYNIKGGVGKTAAAVNLAHAAALDGMRVLLWDLDPQGASSYYFRIKARVKGGTAALLKKKNRLQQAIKATDYQRLDLIPADFSYRNLDLALDNQEQSRRRLGKLLHGLDDDYELILLDCPPSVSMLSENVLHAADALLVPLIPTNLSLRAYKQLRRFRREMAPGETRLLPFFSMVDRRRKLHREVVNEFASCHENLLRTYIPYSSIVEQMGRQRAPVTHFAPRSEPARAFRQLWNEVRMELDHI